MEKTEIVEEVASWHKSRIQQMRTELLQVLTGAMQEEQVDFGKVDQFFDQKYGRVDDFFGQSFSSLNSQFALKTQEAKKESEPSNNKNEGQEKDKLDDFAIEKENPYTESPSASSVPRPDLKNSSESPGNKSEAKASGKKELGKSASSSTLGGVANFFGKVLLNRGQIDLGRKDKPYFDPKLKVWIIPGEPIPVPETVPEMVKPQKNETKEEAPKYGSGSLLIAKSRLKTPKTTKTEPKKKISHEKWGKGQANQSMEISLTQEGIPESQPEDEYKLLGNIISRFLQQNEKKTEPRVETIHVGPNMDELNRKIKMLKAYYEAQIQSLTALAKKTPFVQENSIEDAILNSKLMISSGVQCSLPSQNSSSIRYDDSKHFNQIKRQTNLLLGLANSINRTQSNSKSLILDDAMNFLKEKQQKMSVENSRGEFTPEPNEGVSLTSEVSILLEDMTKIIKGKKEEAGCNDQTLASLGEVIKCLDLSLNGLLKNLTEKTKRLQESLENSESKINELREKIEEYESEKEENQRNEEKLLEEISKLKENLFTTHGSLQSHQEHIRTLEYNLKRMDRVFMDEKAKNENELRSKGDHIAKLENVIRKNNGQFSEIIQKKDKEIEDSKQEAEILKGKCSEMRAANEKYSKELQKKDAIYREIIEKNKTEFGRALGDLEQEIQEKTKEIWEKDQTIKEHLESMRQLRDEVNKKGHESQNNARISEQLAKEIKESQSQRSLFESQIANAQREVTEIKNQRDQLKSQVASAQMEATETKGLLVKQRQEFEAKLRDTKEKKKSLKANLRELEERHGKIIEENEKLIESLKAENKKTLSQLEKEKKSIEDAKSLMGELREENKGLGKKCEEQAICIQQMEQTKVDNAKLVSLIKANNAKFVQTLQERDALIEKYEKEVKELENKLEKLKNVSASKTKGLVLLGMKLKENLSRLKNEIIEEKKEISKTSNGFGEHLSQVSAICSQAFRAQIKKIHSIDKESSEKTLNFKKKIEDLEEKLEKLNSELSKSQKARQAIEKELNEKTENLEERASNEEIEQFVAEIDMLRKSLEERNALVKELQSSLGGSEQKIEKLKETHESLSAIQAKEMAKLKEKAESLAVEREKLAKNHEKCQFYEEDYLEIKKKYALLLMDFDELKEEMQKDRSTGEGKEKGRKLNEIRIGDLEDENKMLRDQLKEMMSEQIAKKK